MSLASKSAGPEALTGGSIGTARTARTIPAKSLILLDGRLNARFRARFARLVLSD